MSDFWLQTAAEAFGASILFFLALWWFIRTLRKPDSSKVSKVLIGLLCLFLVMAPLNVIGRALLDTKFAPVQTMVVRQPAPSTTADLNQAYVAEVQKALVDELNANLPSSHRAEGLGSVLEKDGIRLGIVRIKIGGKTSAVTAFVIQDEQLVRVTCAVPDIRDVDVRAANCVEEMTANLGTSLE